MRDSLSVLERVLAFCGHEVADEEALQGARRVCGTEVLTEMVRSPGRPATPRGDAGACWTSCADEGHDLVHFWGELIAVLRDLLARAQRRP